MDASAFTAQLAAEGFADPVNVEREADGFLDVHTHPFEAWALILEGDITIRCGDEERVYRAGETFRLMANVPHQEHYGTRGVRYLVGRR